MGAIATTVARLQAVLHADTRDFDRAMDGSESKMHGVGKAAGLLGLAIAGGLGVAAKIGFDEMMQGQKVTAQTEAVLKSTGGTAGVTAGQVDRLATSLLRKTGVDDEQIKSGENMLLTFTKIHNQTGKGNDIFNQATRATLDLSVAMGKDMTGSAILVGKALNDPVAGLGALRRVGVSFDNVQKGLVKDLVDGADALRGLGYTSAEITAPQMEILSKAVKNHVAPVDALKMAHVQLTDAQQKVFKHMTEGGHVIEAQKMILKELQTEFGGSANAAGKTLAGQLNIAKETFRNLTAELVTSLLPAFQGFITAITTAVNWMAQHTTATKIIVGVLGTLAAVLVTASVATQLGTAAATLHAAAIGIVAAATKAWTVIQIAMNAVLAGNPIALVILALVALGAGLVLAYQHSETFRRIVKDAFEKVKAAADDVKDLMVWFRDTGAGIFAKLHDAWDGPLGKITTLWLHFGNPIGVAIEAIKWLRDVGPGAITALHKAVEKPLEALAGAFRQVAHAVDAVIDAIKWVISHADAVSGTIGKVAGVIGKIPGIGDAGDANFTPPAASFGAVAGVVGGDSTINKSLWDELGLARQMGLTLTSGYRPGAITKHGTPSDHGTFPSNAIDVAGPAGLMAAFFQRLIGDSGVKQAFYDPLGSIFGGALSSYREGGHSDHVHVATYDQGGFLQPGWNLAYNGLGRPEAVGAGGTFVTVNVPGLIGSPDELSRRIADLLTSFKRGGGTLGFA